MYVTGDVQLTGSKAANAVAIVPSDTTDLPNGVTAALYVGLAGDVRVTLSGMADNTFVTFASLTEGFEPLAVKRVWATGTSASNLLAVY